MLAYGERQNRDVQQNGNRSQTPPAVSRLLTFFVWIMGGRF